MDSKIPDTDITLNSLREMYTAGPSPMSPDGLRLMCLQYEPLFGRWYYRLPDIMRAGMEQQGYDADIYFAKVSANWEDPNER